jgi:pimeloyl-ACP methyl ester carboxylesterase
MSMATYVVVHGAWGGAWSWNKIVVPMLRAAGHEVHAVTLTGLGERKHLATPDVNLDTHIQDVVNVLFYEDLHDVILVGHSYGGMVITGVADKSADRIKHLVYLDAATPKSGTSLVDRFPGRLADLTAQAQASGDGWRIPPGPVPSDQPDEITEWATPRRVSQPLKTFTQPLALEHGDTTLPRTFVYCSVDKAADSPQARRAAEIEKDPSWNYVALETGHNLHYSAPQETVDILIGLPDRPGRQVVDV